MNILAVGAHFDDVELGCSGTLINHVKRGDNVTVLVVTDSAYSSPDGAVIRGQDIAGEEGAKAAEIIGAELICLQQKTFRVEVCDALITEVYRIITERNIDTVYCHWTGDIHRDHHNTAKITLMASRHVPRVLMYRSNYYDSEQIFRGNLYSDISDSMGQKIAAIKAHRSEMERVRWQWIEFFEHNNRNEGQKMGVRYAEAFEVVRYLL